MKLIDSMLLGLAAAHVPKRHPNRLPAAAVTAAPQVTVEDIYIDAMFAIPSQVLGVPRSIQVPWQDIEVYTRKLSAGNNYVENFTSISPAVGAICCALRTSDHTINTNRELYALGGGPKGFKNWSFSLGNLQLPVRACERAVAPPPPRPSSSCRHGSSLFALSL